MNCDHVVIFLILIFAAKVGEFMIHSNHFQGSGFKEEKNVCEKCLYIYPLSRRARARVREYIRTFQKPALIAIL